MRKNKQEMNEMVFKYAKEVLLDAGSGYEYEIARCMSLRQLLKIVNRYSDLYSYAEQLLYNVTCFYDMEKIVSVMNVLFDNDEFKELKKDLYHHLVKAMSVDRYCVLRHLVCLNEMELIELLYKEGYADAYECAKYCLIEEDYISALYYLRELDHCDDENILDIIASYSFVEYIKLVRFYKKKAGVGILAYG